MKQNICVIGLYNNYIKTLAKAISDSFDMIFADVMDLIRFDLLDIENARSICGDDYIKKIEKNKVRNICSYNNTLFTIDYSLLNDENNYNEIKETSYVIYLKLSKLSLESKLLENGVKQSEVNLKLDLYDYRNTFCEKFADFVIECDNKNANDIIKLTKQVFLGE